MLCPHCGSESSDKARSCPSCGYKFVLETSSDVTSDTAAQEKQLKRLFRAAFVLVTLAAIFWLATTRLSNQQSQPEQNPAMISQPIVSGRITVNAFWAGGREEMKTKKEPVVRATLRLPQSLWAAVQHQAIDEHVTAAELVARALREFLKKGGRQ
jgi:zinc-ribbon domain